MYKIPDNLDDSLTKFECCYTKVSKIENLPSSLTCFDCLWNNIKYIDNIPIEQLNFSMDSKFIRQYNTIKRLQRRIRRRTKREKAAKIIQAGCENWLYKPYCNDNTIGIVPRLAMKELGLI